MSVTCSLRVRDAFAEFGSCFFLVFVATPLSPQTMAALRPPTLTVFGCHFATWKLLEALWARSAAFLFETLRDYRPPPFVLAVVEGAGGRRRVGLRLRHYGDYAI